MLHLATMWRVILSLPGAIIFLTFLLVPMLVMLRYSFASSENLRISLIWTLDNYAVFFEKPLYFNVLLRSVTVAGVVSLFTVLIGFPAAWVIARAPERFRTMLLVLLIIPWWASYIVRVFGWYTMFGNSGVINETLVRIGIVDEPLAFFAFNMPAVIVTEVNLFLPLMVLPIYMTLERMDPNLMLAARSLGATRWYAFWRVVVPLSLPGVVAGVIFVFMPVAGTFIVPQLVGGTNSLMIGNVISSQFGGASNWALGSALAIILLIVLLGTLSVLAWVRRRTAGAFH